MVIPCALCQTAAASVFCVNDDAHLCTSCDASVHAGNPLLARHERRPIACTAAECASAAHGSPVSTDCCDVAVVPQFVSASAAAPAEPTEPESALMQPAAPAADASFAPFQQQYAPYQHQFEQYGQQQAAALAPVAAEPLSLYEDAFFSRNLTTSDLLDFDSDDLVLPGSTGAGSFAYFDPLDDCVVPSFGASATFQAPADRYMPAAAPAHLHAQQSFMQQPNSYMSPYIQQQQPNHLVPMGGMSAAAAAPRPVAVQQQVDPEAEAARVQRHRERQRKKRAFGRAVRYQSRRAYAEIRPRIKGRFVTPEEYAVYQAQQAAAAKAGLPVDDPEHDDMAYDEAAYEVPVGKGAYEAAYAPVPAVAPAVSEEDAAVPVYVA